FSHELCFGTKTSAEITSFGHSERFCFEEVNFFAHYFRCKFPQRTYIINNNNAASVGTHYNIVCSLLKIDKMNCNRRHIIGELRPIFSTVNSDIKTEFSSK